MSSTSGDVHDFEAYQTPPWAIERLLERVWLPFDNYVEPCAGEGNIIRAIAKHSRSRAKDPCAIEIQPQFEVNLRQLVGPRRVIIGDALEELPLFPPRTFSLACTNPPFSLAFPILKELRRVSQWVVLLLRTGFFEGGASEDTEERAAFLDEDFPDVHYLPNRPGFRRSKKTGKWGTDSATYCWAVWTPEERRTGRTSRLAVTPKDVRVAWNKLMRARSENEVFDLPSSEEAAA